MAEPGAKKRGTVVVGVRLYPDVAARIDAARGTMTRSAWLEQAVLAFLDSGAVLASLDQDPARLSDLRAALRGSPEVMERLRKAQERPLPRACPHKKRGGWCVRCRALVDSDGFPLRVP